MAKTTTANPARPKSYNGYMTASGWGTIYLRIMFIEKSLSIISTTSQQRFGNTLYMHKRTQGSFNLGLRCTSFAEADVLAKWLRGYGRKAGDPDGKVGACRVVFPGRNFDMLAVPTGLASHGDTNTEIVYDFTVEFKGARDPSPKAASTFSLPKNTSDPALPYFYPAGTQLSGTGSADDSLYGSSTTAGGYETDDGSAPGFTSPFGQPGLGPTYPSGD